MRSVRQSALTISAPVKPNEVNTVNALLQTIRGDLAQKRPVLFSELPSVHFACWLVIDNDPNYPPVLTLEVNYDGDREALLEEMTRKMGATLNDLYGHCIGYPPLEERGISQVKDYLRQHAIPTAALYVGCPGLSVASVRNAIAVREEARRFLDSADGRLMARTMTAVQLQQQINQHLCAPGGVKPVVSPVTLQRKRFRAWFSLVVIILIALPLLIVLLPLLLIALLRLRFLEIRDARHPAPPPPPIDPRLYDCDIPTQNHLTTLVDVKPGEFRLYLLKTVLWLINLLARAFFTTGKLAGIPTIHFARWLLTDNNRRLLFFSNYDGSWASYLGDFVDRAAFGLTAVWGNTVGFPPARYLGFGGAKDIAAFKEWSREHNVFAPVFYSAYANETVWNLLKDMQFRDGVGNKLNEKQAAALLQLL